MKLKSNYLILGAGLLIAVALSSCTPPHPDPHVRQGRTAGAVVGGVAGAVIGNNVKGGNSWGGAAIGTAVGILAGDQRGKVNSMYSGYSGPRNVGYYYY